MLTLIFVDGLSSLHLSNQSPETGDFFDHLVVPNVLSGFRKRIQPELSFLELNGPVVLWQSKDQRRVCSRDICKRNNARRLGCTS